MRWALWSGRRERLVLGLLAVVVLAVGLALIAILTDSIKGTVTKAYEQTWRAPYDILVHLPLENGTQLTDVTEPNVLTTLPSGITTQQWETVRHLPGVAVAAPIAVVGYVRAGPVYPFPSADIADVGAGVYRITTKVTSTGTGATEAITEAQTVAVADKTTGKKPNSAPADIVVVDHQRVRGINVSAQIPTFLVGIDPDAENRLIGLDGALTSGQTLMSGERIRTFSLDLLLGQEKRQIPVAVLPVMVNEQALQDLSYSVLVEELDKDQQVSRVVTQKNWTGPELAGALRQGEGVYTVPLGQSGPVRYEPASSPFPGRWPLAFSLVESPADVASAFPRATASYKPDLQLGPSFRTWAPYRGPAQFQYQVKGYFDPSRLSASKDPRSQLPMMTYRPAEAMRVLDAAGRPVNPPQQLSGGLSPVGYLSSPPVMLTTIEGATALAGDRAINAIQVKVSGADHFTPESVASVKAIAAEIERQTGLIAEVTMGSSPVNVLVQVPGAAGGWVEEAWIHKNAAVTMVQQVEFGYGGYSVLVVLVAALYALATGLTGVTARRRELGLVTALGWPGGAVRRMVLGEQLLFALAAGLLAALAALLFKAAPLMVFTVFALALGIYLPAFLVCSLAAARTAPGEALRWGDTAPGRRILPGAGVLSLALSSLMGRPGRTLLTVLATALPTALLVVLSYISRYLRGVLFTTVTGEYAALKAGPLQYAAGVIALVMAAVTALDLIRQNAADHRDERALLYALGWPLGWIARATVVEGLLLGAIAGIAGDLLGVGLIALLYGTAAVGVWMAALVIWTLPLGLGILAGLLSCLTEMRSWNRTRFGSVQPQEVARFGKAARLAAVALLLAMLGTTAGLAGMRLIAAWKASAAVSGPSEADQATTAIADAVARQNDALAKGDSEAYLATLDPAAQAYVAEQRHWADDVRFWQTRNPGARITRTVSRLALLGSDTAHVWIRQDGGAGATVLETVWVRTTGGDWVEHGRNHEVMAEGGITLWYPPGMPEATAREILKRAGEASGLLERIGYAPERPLTLEVFDNADAFRESLGPYLSGAGIAQFWTGFGEPVRFYMDQDLPSVNGIAYHLLMQTATERAQNHAPIWLAEGARLYLDTRLDGLTLAEQIQRFPAVQPLPPVQFAEVPSNVDHNALPYARISVSGLLFVAYLQAEYGPDTLNRVLDTLGAAAPDPRAGGPETDPERNAMTIKAVEQATGTDWDTLSRQFMAWAAQQPLRR